MDEALFSTPNSATERVESVSKVSVSDEHVHSIRAEFDRLGISSMEARKEAVEAAARRPVGTLRELTAIEGRRLIGQLRERKVTPKKVGGSAWDDREEDTWIDKL